MSEELRALRRLSHDLRGSVANLRIGLQACQENAELFVALGESMLSEVERLDRRLLQLSWLGRSAYPIEQTVPLDKLVEQWSPIPAGTESVTASLDPDLWEAAFKELMRNAQEHGQGVAAISLRNDGPDWVLQIDDNGAGFPEGLSDWIFREGMRLWRERPALGLRLAQRVALAHGGTLRLDSREGGGSVVLRIPRGTD